MARAEYDSKTDFQAFTQGLNLYFGSFSAFLLAVYATLTYLGQLPLACLGWFLWFFFGNMLVSQFAFRSARPLTIEIFRIFGVGVPSTFMASQAGGPGLMWPLFLLMSLGNGMAFFALTGRSRWPYLLSLFWTLLFIAAIRTGPREWAWSHAIVFSGVMVVTNAVMILIMRVLSDSIQREANARMRMLHASKMSALGEMAGGMAHEINTPLAVIKTTAGQMSELLSETEIDRALLTGMTAEIERTTDRIAAIIRGLRSFSRDGSRDAFYDVDVSKLISDTISFCGERFRQAGADLNTDGVAPGLHFEGREVEISQVLVNLLNNALDALQSAPEKWVRISAHQRDGWVEIHVTDSGRLSPEVEKKLFQPFFTTKEVGRGTGLGLSVSAGLIRTHGGELKFSRDGEQTRFIVRLPVRASPQRPLSV